MDKKAHGLSEWCCHTCLHIARKSNFDSLTRQGNKSSRISWKRVAEVANLLHCTLAYIAPVILLQFYLLQKGQINKLYWNGTHDERTTEDPNESRWNMSVRLGLDRSRQRVTSFSGWPWSRLCADRSAGRPDIWTTRNKATIDHKLIEYTLLRLCFPSDLS